MEQVYVIIDWSAISQMKNQKDSDLRADAAFFKGKSGFLLTIYDSQKNSILYRSYVDAPDVWSISKETAVEILNSYGFPCKLPDSVVKLLPETVDALKEAIVVGYRFIMKNREGLLVVSCTSFTFKSFYCTPEVSSNLKDLLSTEVIYVIEKIIEGEGGNT